MVLVHKHMPVCAPVGMCAHPAPPQHTHTHTDSTRKSGRCEWSEQLGSQMSIIKEVAVEAALLCPLSVHLLSHGNLGTLTVSVSCERSGDASRGNAAQFKLGFSSADSRIQGTYPIPCSVYSCLRKHVCVRDSHAQG